MGFYSQYLRPVSEQEVLTSLHSVKWRTVLEIEDRIRRYRFIPEDLPFWKEMIISISITRIYVIVHELVDQSFVEARIRADRGEDLAIKGGVPRTEYRLTEAGLWVKNKKLTHVIGAGSIQPSPSNTAALRGGLFHI